MRAEVAGELNVKQVVDVEGLEALMSWTIVPNFRALGPRFGPRVNDIKAALASDIFQNVTTGPKRKYFRAVQNAMVSVGAARQVLFDSYKTINYLKARPASPQVKAQMYEAAVTAQKQAYDRIQDALKMVQDSLTMPSATHGYEAPGID